MFPQRLRSGEIMNGLAVTCIFSQRLCPSKNHVPRFSRNCGCHLSGIWDRSVRRGASEKSEQPIRMEKWSKITLFFTRRYLENRKTYRDKWRSVSKGKVPRFWWSFASWPEVIILRVTAVQIFPNFNRSLIESR